MKPGTVARYKSALLGVRAFARLRFLLLPEIHASVADTANSMQLNAGSISVHTRPLSGKNDVSLIELLLRSLRHAVGCFGKEHIGMQCVAIVLINTGNGLESPIRLTKFLLV